MKKVFIMLGVIALLASCTQVTETEEYKSLEAKSDSLTSVTQGQNTEIYDYLTDFNSIQDNLNEIKKHEKIISIHKSDSDATHSRTQINNDINSIYSLLIENKERLSSLNQKYKNSNHKNKELNKLLKALNQQVLENNSEIQSLNLELKNLNYEIKDLTDELIGIQIKSESQAFIIENQINELNTAFYVVGSSKELKEHKIITKDGGFIGIGKNTKLDSNFDKAHFTEINTTSFLKIAIFSKKAKLITTHPSGSYEWDKTTKKVDNLVIKDSQAFWSVSKFLVIEATN